MFGIATRSLARTAASSSRALPRRAAPSLAQALPLRCFSASPRAWGQGETDVALSNVLAQEIGHEKLHNTHILSETGSEPDFVTRFRNKGIWKIDDNPGGDEVILTREFGNEHIRILLSIGDLDTNPENEDIANGEDVAQTDVDPKHDNSAFPVRLAITISKPGNGALTIEAQARDGHFGVDQVSYFQDAKIAEELTPEADWARRSVYIGPMFETLDGAVQEGFGDFLAERGIDQDLALFLPSFAEYKEQKEYCHWLGNVKKFVDA